MSEFTNILYEKCGAIATITVNRPKVLNALSKSTLDEIGAAVQQAGEDPEVRGVILTGNGDKAFVAGADIKEFAGVTAPQAEAFTRAGQAVLNQIESLGKPVIAAVNGLALGGGCELAMACTLRIAATHAAFGQPEVRLGLTPGFGGTQRLPRLVGKGRALQLILSAEPIDANHALQIGLVNEVVEPGELLSRAGQILTTIAGNAPLAVRYAIEAVNRGMEASQSDGLALEGSYFAVCCASVDMQEGVAAFLERRKPVFQGR
jgi:enoyl-CoA hydratase/carnithine racemase